MYDKTNEEERDDNMPIIKAPPRQPKAVTIQARVEESVKTQLDQYAKFIDCSPSYVITEALKVLFKRDDEFKAWLGQQSATGKIHELTGGGLKETA
jgi:predicted transcriptional regulator